VTLIELLDNLGVLGVQLWAEGDRLRLRAPAGALTSELRAALDAHKPALLAQLQSSIDEDRRTPIVPAPSSGARPLSFAQQRLWFLSQLEPDSAAYNIPAAIRIGGAFDRAVLARAINEIVRRHEVLRTTFHDRDGEAMATIHDAMTIDVPLVELGDHDAAAQQAELRRIGAAQTRAPFDLSRGPLLRLTLVRLGADDHVLLFTVHHLVSDGWSSRVFMREVAVLYEAFAHGRPSPLPDLPIQYGDFAAWQRQWLRGDTLDRQLAYWRAQLDRAPVLELPTDRPRPAVQTFDGASIQFTLPRELGDRLHGLAREEGVTRFQLLLSAFAALLHQITGAEDVLIGSPVANRNRRELEDLIGFFVNTVILRVNLSGRPTFRELLRRVRQTTLEAYAHQDLPFEQLVAALQPKRDLSRHALFQVVFVLQDNPVERQDVPGLTLRQLDTDSYHVKFDLVVNAWDGQDGLTVWWEYNSTLFDRDTIAALFDRYVRLLSGVVDRPSAAVDELEILSAGELAQLAADPSVPALDGEFAW
jgi:hypothetical protein